MVSCMSKIHPMVGFVVDTREGQLSDNKRLVMNSATIEVNPSDMDTLFVNIRLNVC